MFKNKLKAFTIHFLLSLVLISLLLGLIVYFWFPLEYLNISSFKDITLLIITIDLILGPILTFIVFNPLKKSLKFDLSTIVVLQIAALSYGVFALYQTHPLFITYKHGTFNLVYTNEVNLDNAKHNEFRVSTLSSGNLAFTQLPKDPQKQAEMIMAIDLKGEPDIDKRVELYEPYENHLETILAKTLDATTLFSEKQLDEPRKEFLAKYEEKENYVYLPLKGAGAIAIIVLDKKTAKPVTTIQSNPWKQLVKK